MKNPLSRNTTKPVTPYTIEIPFPWWTFPVKLTTYFILFNLLNDLKLSFLGILGVMVGFAFLMEVAAVLIDLPARKAAYEAVHGAYNPEDSTPKDEDEDQGE